MAKKKHKKKKYIYIVTIDREEYIETNEDSMWSRYSTKLKAIKEKKKLLKQQPFPIKLMSNDIIIKEEEID